MQLQRGPETAAVTARVVLAAGGLSANLPAAEPGCETAVADGSRIGAGVVTDRAPNFYTPGTVFMACARGGYVGLVRLEDGRLDLAAALDAAFVRGCGGPGPAAEAVLANAGFPAVPELSDLPWRGTPALTRRRPVPAAERLFVIGDAAGYIEPFTGEGLAWALASARAVVPLALRGLNGWDPALVSAWAAVYRHTVARRQGLCRVAARVLRHPLLTAAVVRLLAHVPAAAGPVVRRLQRA